MLINKKIRDLELSYREVEEQAKVEIRSLKNKNEYLQREVDDKDDRILRQIDPEVQRVKIKKEVQVLFESELNAKQYEIDKVSEELYEQKRNLETLRLSFDWYKEDKEKEICVLKDKYQVETNEMIVEIQNLQHKLDG